MRNRAEQEQEHSVEPEREGDDLYVGIRAALAYHLRSGASPTQAVARIAANLDEQGRREMIELGLLAVVDEIVAQGNR